MIDTGAGVVDADYRGVIFVLLFNHSDDDFPGMLQSFTSYGQFLTGINQSEGRRPHRTNNFRENLYT